MLADQVLNPLDPLFQLRRELFALLMLGFDQLPKLFLESLVLTLKLAGEAFEFGAIRIGFC